MNTRDKHAQQMTASIEQVAAAMGTPVDEVRRMGEYYREERAVAMLARREEREAREVGTDDALRLKSLAHLIERRAFALGRMTAEDMIAVGRTDTRRILGEQRRLAHARLRFVALANEITGGEAVS